ncbi:hypothetical protein HF1_05530 [Mycoplasma haemofelis str. Langford 1]|uniref:Uncharacterized protein n=1 Tax=Mycoplasma haemofelis (strain Langford 1) TaxID=941640 RepID=E8ZHE0_MYCHL|nr:hypothetical protein [Mycoplasma haemofelis]CBY92561.1 hypothetical protein HF1_05530 [Mycoplasma haemofelis str. Langford 1]
MSYKLMGAAALTGTAGATGLVVANKEKIFGKSRTLADELKEKGYKMVSSVDDGTKRKTILDAKVSAYKAVGNSSQEFKGKSKDAMNSDVLLKTCRELEKSTDYESLSSIFKKWCSLDFKDVLVTVGGRSVISDTPSDGTNWKNSLTSHREKMKTVITGVTESSSDSSNSQWNKAKEWCEGKLGTQYSNDSKVDFDRVEEWCLAAKAQ